MMRYEIVIAGGGFAGAYAAREFGRAWGRDGGVMRVALVAERNVLTFQPMLAEVAGSSLNPTDVVNPLRHFCRGVDVLQGVIQRIDWSRRELVVDGGRFTRDHTIGFDQLVLAVGSVTDLSAVPGMAEYGWPMKNVADALRLRAALINRLEEANLVDDPAVRTRLMTFVVVGGGYTGVETAGQMFDFLSESRRFYANLRDTPPRVVLAHSGERLLGDIGADLGEYARRTLAARGIEIRLKCRVSEVSAMRVHFQGGDSIEAHTIVTTVGSGTNPVVVDLARQLGIPLSRGRFPVEPTLQVAGQAGLWAAGDCAAVPWDDRGTTKVSPPTAQFAMRQGRQLALNLMRVRKGEKPRPFRYRYLGQLAAIGERAAVAEVFGFHFRGFLAWWLWRTIYLAKLPGTLRKLRVMTDWTFELIFARDISLFLPAGEEVLRSIHLEAGERLFTSGDPCRAYFYLRKGSLALSGAGRADRTLPAGSVVDQAELGADGAWGSTATALESSDVTIFRGRAFQLLRTELRLTPQTR
jgi:NADH dehydrogenase